MRLLYILSFGIHIFHLAGIPIYILHSLYYLKKIYKNIVVNEIIAVFLVIFFTIYPSVLFLSGYIEYSDVVLWVYFFISFYIISKVRLTRCEIKKIIMFLIVVNATFGVIDELLKIALSVKLIALFPQLSEIRLDQLHGINFKNFTFYRAQGVFSEPSFFAIQSVILGALGLQFLHRKFAIYVLTGIIIFFSYSVIGFFPFGLLSISYFFLTKGRERLYIMFLFTIAIAWIYFDGNILYQVNLKLSGEHFSGMARYEKLVLALQNFSNSPFFGFQPGYFISLNGTQPGNLFVLILLEFGIIGLISILCYIYYTCHSIFKRKYFWILLIQILSLFFHNQHYVVGFFIIFFMLNAYENSEIRVNKSTHKKLRPV